MFDLSLLATITSQLFGDDIDAFGSLRQIIRFRFIYFSLTGLPLLLHRRQIFEKLVEALGQFFANHSWVGIGVLQAPSIKGQLCVLCQFGVPRRLKVYTRAAEDVKVGNIR